MKRIISYILLLSPGALIAAVDYNVPIGIRNLMPVPTTSVVLSYRYDDNGFHENGHELGVIQPSQLTEAGKEYINTLQLGVKHPNGDTPIILKIAVTFQATPDNPCARNTDGTCTVVTGITNPEDRRSYQEIAYNVMHENGAYGGPRRAFVHFVILPSGKVVRVAEFIEKADHPNRGAIILADGSVINNNNTVAIATMAEDDETGIGLKSYPSHTEPLRRAVPIAENGWVNNTP